MPYRVHAVAHTAGELDSDAYRGLSPFRQAPVIDDDGFVVAESAALVLYLAAKAGKLIPGDVQGRTRVVQWCLAAVSTVEPTLACMDLIGIFDSGKAARELHEQVPKLARRWLSDVERRLEGREWIACADFTLADMPGWLREATEPCVLWALCNLRGGRTGPDRFETPRFQPSTARRAVNEEATRGADSVADQTIEGVNPTGARAAFLLLKYPDRTASLPT